MKFNTSTSTLLANMEKAFTNAKADNFQTKLAPTGFDVTTLDGLLKQLTDVRTLLANKTDKYAIQIKTTAEIEEKREDINDEYKWYLSFAKVLFSEDTEAIKDLELTWARKVNFNEWIDQVWWFYTAILKNETYIAKFATINITKETLEASSAEVEALRLLKTEQAKMMAEAQKATETKDIALENLNEKYSELIKLAKIFFKDDQELEALGILVRR